MKYKLAIFDMDGTILDTLEDLADTTNYCMRAFHLPERSLDEVRQFVGNGIHKTVERAVPAGTSDEQIEEIFALFNSYYKDHCAIKTRPYSGITEVIRSLREQGVKTAVVSNKADYGVKELCKQYFDGLFDCSIGDREGQRKKPCPDSVYAVLQELGFEKKDAVYIGDSEVDIATAKNAGLDMIITAWGFRDVEFLKKQGAEHIISSPRELFAQVYRG